MFTLLELLWSQHATAAHLAKALDSAALAQLQHAADRSFAMYSGPTGFRN